MEAQSRRTYSADELQAALKADREEELEHPTRKRRRSAPERIGRPERILTWVPGVRFTLAPRAQPRRRPHGRVGLLPDRRGATLHDARLFHHRYCSDPATPGGRRSIEDTISRHADTFTGRMFE